MSEDQADYGAETEDAAAMLGAGYKDTKIKNDSNDHKYFIITPRIVKAYSRTPYDLALWDTIKDIAGDAGECYLSTSDLGHLSGMSAGQVSLSRQYWIELGFLKGEVRRDPGYPQPVWHLSVPDLWKKNIEWCEKHPKIADRIAFRLSQKSLHTVKPSPGERGTPPGELKNTKKDLKSTTTTVPNIFKLYESNIGPITPLIADGLKDLEKTYSAEWVARAIQEAASNNVRKLSYIQAVLEGYKERGSPDIPRDKTKFKINNAKPSSEPKGIEAGRRFLERHGVKTNG